MVGEETVVPLAKAAETADPALLCGADAHQLHVTRHGGAERVVDVERELDVRS